MATDTADATRTRPDPTKRLWQVPTFLLGIAAFGSAYAGLLPFGPPDPSSAFRRDVAALRAIAEKSTADLGDLKAQVARVAGAIESFPESAPAAHFALGSSYIRIAELTPDPAEAKNYWMLAKQHFDSIRTDQFTEPAEAIRLAYRAAKARAAELPATTTAAEIDLTRRLLLSTPMGEDPGEGHRLAGDLGLRLTPPDLQQAKGSYAAYIAEAGLGTPPAAIARVKLRLSDVHRQLGDIDGAKKWLGQIGPDAPPDVLLTAKGQLARIRMAEGDLPGAIREWELVRKVPQLPAEMRSASAYYLGACLLASKATDGAAKLFEEAAKSEGPEGMAALVRLAELRARDENPARRREAVGLLAASVKGIASPRDYPKGALLPIHEVQAAFESTVQAFANEGAYDSAVAVADSYKAVAAAGRDREKRAEVLAAWGAAIQRMGGDGSARFAAAAAEYSALTELRPAHSEKADLLRKAAALFRQAGDTASALAVLEMALKYPMLSDEIAGPVWLEYAEGLLAANRSKEALEAFKAAMLRFGPAATAARYRVARRLIDSRIEGNVELGIELMDQVARAEQIAVTEQEMQERALVEVAHEYIRKGNFGEAETRLEKQLKLYANGGESGLGKLLLGVCLLQRADPRAKPPASNPAKNRDEALRLFKLVVAEVEARKRTNQPVDRDPWLRTQANLRVLQTYQQMSKPNDVLLEGGKLRDEFAGTVDELIVLSLMFHAFKQQDKSEGTLFVLGQMRDVFEKLKDKPGAFWAKSGEYSREYWEKVWFAPEPMLKK